MSCHGDPSGKCLQQGLFQGALCLQVQSHAWEEPADLFQGEGSSDVVWGGLCPASGSGRSLRAFGKARGLLVAFRGPLCNLSDLNFTLLILAFPLHWMRNRSLGPTSSHKFPSRTSDYGRRLRSAGRRERESQTGFT